MSDFTVVIVGHELPGEPHVAAKCPAAGRRVVVVTVFETVFDTVFDTVDFFCQRNPPLLDVHR
jgi:hypothetical protein